MLRNVSCWDGGGGGGGWLSPGYSLRSFKGGGGGGGCLGKLGGVEENLLLVLMLNLIEPEKVKIIIRHKQKTNIHLLIVVVFLIQNCFIKQLEQGLDCSYL